MSYLTLHLEPGDKRPPFWRTSPAHTFLVGFTLGVTPAVVMLIARIVGWT